MKTIFHSRKWHIWVSVILSLPILTVALTAVFLAHRKALGGDEMTVAANWLPGYQQQAGQAGRIEARASLVTARGDIYVGTLNGLYRLAGSSAVAVEALAGTQVRGLAEAAWGRVAAARNGIWVERGGNWERVRKGDAWSAAARPDGSVVVAVRDKGLLVSRDGEDWLADPLTAGPLADLPAPAEQITFSRLIMDLHSGRALFGRDGDWMWIDTIGAAMSLLALTGVYMWGRNQWRRRRSQAAKAAFKAATM